MTSQEIKEFLKNNNLGVNLKDLNTIKCELLDDNFSLAHIYKEELPFSKYYIISVADKRTIMMETMDRACRKSYKLLFPLDKRQFKYTNGILIMYNDTDKRFGIYNLKTNKFELNEVNTIESIDFFSEFSHQDFLIKDKRHSGIGLLSIREGRQLIIPAKYVNIKELVVNAMTRVYEVEDKNHQHGLYAYYKDKNCRYLTGDDKNVYLNAIKQSVIPPMFDKIGKVYDNIKIHQPTGDTICYGIYAEVFVDGKVGLLDVINKYFVMPVIFDKIDISNLSFNKSEQFINRICGYIDNKKYVYFNNQLCEINPAEITDQKTNELTEKLIRTKRKR